MLLFNLLYRLGCPSRWFNYNTDFLVLNFSIRSVYLGDISPRWLNYIAPWYMPKNSNFLGVVLTVKAL